MAWLSDDEITKRLRIEAEKDCARLGHRMGGWTLTAKTYTAHCAACQATCLVSPRLIGKMRIRGDATQFRCPK